VDHAEFSPILVNVAYRTEVVERLGRFRVYELTEESIKHTSLGKSRCALLFNKTPEERTCGPSSSVINARGHLLRGGGYISSVNIDASLLALDEIWPAGWKNAAKRKILPPESGTQPRRSIISIDRPAIAISRRFSPPQFFPPPPLSRKFSFDN